MHEWMMRFRSSSRCSRNDIFPPAGLVVVVVGRELQRRRTAGRERARGPWRLRLRACWLAGVTRNRFVRRDGTVVRDAAAGAAAGAVAALDASTVARCSSSRISSSSVLFSSFDARLNSARLLPSERPSSGSFRGPKMIRAITKMMISSGMPMEPNIAVSYFPKPAVNGLQSIIGTGLPDGSRKSRRPSAQKSLLDEEVIC